MAELKTARMTLLASILVCVIALGLGVLKLGPPGLFFLIDMAATAFIAVSALACTALQLRMRLLRRRGAGGHAEN